MSQPTPPAMIGGVRNILVDFSKKQSTHAEILFVILLVLGIVFPTSIPVDIRKQLTTVPGRVLLFAVLVALLMYTNWVNGLLFAVFIAVMLSIPIKKEGFMNEYNINIVSTKKKWFVEELLEENPIAIEEDRVETSAVQDHNEARSQDTRSSDY
jgi:phosphatidylserine synthase